VIFHILKETSTGKGYVKRNLYWLVVWNMFFHSVGNVIIPTDELTFFQRVQTTNQIEM